MSKQNDSQIKGVQLLHILAGSPSDIAGMQVSDVIVAVDGIAVSTLQDYAVQASKRGAEMKLDVLRGNSLKEITIGPRVENIN